MFNLPKSTEFGKRIPKQKFYDNLNITPQMKRVFMEQIRLITWWNKIAPSTLNIDEGKFVAEIEVIYIQLNSRDLDRKVLKQIDKEIPYHILFLLEYNDKIQAWIGYKEKGKNTAFKSGVYYHTDWLDPEALNLHIDGLNMDMVYENFIYQIAGEQLDNKDGDIKEAVIRSEQRKKLKKKISALEKKVQCEKQFNKQVEMNNRLKRYKKELEGFINE